MPLPAARESPFVPVIVLATVVPLRVALLRLGRLRAVPMAPALAVQNVEGVRSTPVVLLAVTVVEIGVGSV